MAVQKQAWSYSRLNNFRQCPLKCYWLNFAPKGQRIKPPPSPQMARGRNAHSYCESAAGKLRAGIQPPEHHDFGHIIPFIADFVAGHEGNIQTELQIAFREDLTETTWYAKDVWARIIIDLIGFQGAHANVVDWKTGKPKPDDQLELFAAAAFTKWPELQSVTTYYVFLDYKESIDRSYGRALDHNNIWSAFGDEAEQIQLAYESADWPAKKSGLCPWCPVPQSKCQFSTIAG